jgi:ERCC4-type nuclease
VDEEGDGRQMILLDSRCGSKELLPYFRPYDVTVSLTTLEFGDACFSGNGPDGPEIIGYERKTLHDMVNSMRSKRFAGYQLPGLMNTYSRVGLIVEGIWRAGEGGVAEINVYKKWFALKVGQQPIMYRELDHHLATLEYLCGVMVYLTGRPEQTVAYLVSRYKWWNDKQWSQHQSHLQIYAPCEVQRRRGSFIRRVPGLVEKVAAQLPGVDRKAFELARKFKTVRGLVMAREGDLAAVVGVKRAERIVRELKGW